MDKYSIIYADPPWMYDNKNTGGSMTSGSENQYAVMSVEDICNLPIKEITADNCILFLWWVSSMPEEAIRVAKAWGFKVKTMTGFTWVKLTANEKLHFGMGFYTRMGTENCMIAVKGKPKRISAGVRSVAIEEDFEFEEETHFAKVGKHSEKPDIFRDRIVELMGEIHRIELFARKKVEGWDVFGNEVENGIKLDLKDNVKIYYQCPVCKDKIAISVGDPHWRGKGVHFTNGNIRCRGTYSVFLTEEQYKAE